MNILGIETSCDETAIAVVKNGTEILSNVIASSQELQKQYGGVYPEMAARKQAEVIIPVLDTAINNYGSSIETIDCIAVTNRPGLIGSLLIGVEMAKTLGFTLNKPLIPVDHVKAHIYANWLARRSFSKGRLISNKLPQFPALCLIVSGGHTELALMKDHGDFTLLGQTQDDAAGEAFDKTARLLGLPYPGGPAIEKEAKNGDPKAYSFPRGMIGSKDYKFSFSGFKTAVLRETKKIETVDSPTKADLASSIQEAIVDILVKKTIKAALEFKPKSIIVSGGVAANSRLREKMKEAIEVNNSSIDLYIPPIKLCTDNGAVIASYAFFNNHPTSWENIVATAYS